MYTIDLRIIMSTLNLWITPCVRLLSALAGSVMANGIIRARADGVMSTQHLSE
jgi:hypothetical protein